MEVEFLFTGYWLAISCGGVKSPLLNSGDNGFVNAMAKAAGHFDIGDLAGDVDDYVENHISFCAAWKNGEVGFGGGEVTGAGYVDVSGA